MMTTNFQMLKQLNKEFDPVNRGFLSGEEVQMIKEILCIEERTSVLDLRNLRDFTVMFFQNIKHSLDRDEDYDAWFKISDKVSGITAVIDHRIFDLGGEV